MRRSKRGKGNPPPKNFDEFLAQAQAIARADIRKEAAENHRRESVNADDPANNFHQPSRFLALPPELRMMIYADVVYEDDPLYLAYLRAPTITAVSRQVRAESIASFFALNTFIIQFGTNLCLNEIMEDFRIDYGTLRNALLHPASATDQRWIRIVYASERRAGRMLLSARSQSWLLNISPQVAVFRNVVMFIGDAYGDPNSCDIDPAEPNRPYWVWTMQPRSLRHRVENNLFISLYHSVQMLPHFVNAPGTYEVADRYYTTPLHCLKLLFRLNYRRFRTFNLDALRMLALVVGHWGNFLEDRPLPPPQPPSPPPN